MRVYRPYRARDRAAHRGNRARDRGKRRCSMTAPDDRDPQDDLEVALTHICGVADLLFRLSKEDNGLAYLAGQLRQHLEDAADAFACIFKLNQYREAAQ